MAIQLTYTLGNAGWAYAQVSSEQQTVRMTISYLHDTLTNLADAALSLLLSPSLPQVIVFMDEPGEYQLRLTPDKSGVIQAELRWYNDWQSWGMYAENRYTSALQTTTTASDFALVVETVLDDIWLTHGPEQYKAKWIEHDFPDHQYDRLIQVLKA